MPTINITIGRMPGWGHLPALSVEIDATIEAKFHIRAALMKLVSNGANLSRANLYGATLDGANLDGANLSRANLDGATLSRANLSRANLYGANLDGANLYGATLDGETSLLCYGDMKRIKTMQLDRWAIGYSKTHLQIGCQRHTIEKWARWDTPAGRKWIEAMGSHAMAWADKYLRVVLALAAVNPAE